MLDALIPGIQDQTLSPQDRFGIQTDLYALARSGHANYVDYLKLLRQAYKQEDNLTVWKSILRQLTDLSSILDYSTVENIKPLFQHYVRDLLTNIYSKLDWDPLPNEGLQAAMLRGLILIQMGVNEHGRTSTEAHKRFEKLLQNESINANTRAGIYLTVAKRGTVETFEKLKLVREYLFDKREEEFFFSLSVASSTSGYTRRKYSITNSIMSFR